MKFTYNEVIKGIVHGEEGSINLSFEDATVVAKILVNRGYAVLFSSGDIGDDVRIDWKYAGSTEGLNTAFRENVAFGDPDFVDMLSDGDYIDEDDDTEENDD